LTLILKREEYFRISSSAEYAKHSGVLTPFGYGGGILCFFKGNRHDYFLLF